MTLDRFQPPDNEPSVEERERLEDLRADDWQDKAVDREADGENYEH